MKYETPELIVLCPALNAIQGSKLISVEDNPSGDRDADAAYEDWE